MASKLMRWYPGQARALVWESGLALLSDEVGFTEAEATWEAVRAEPKLSVFLQQLAASLEVDLLSLPEFALAVFEGQMCHLAIRGGMQGEVVVGDETVELSGEGVTTWTEKTIEAPESIALYAAERPADLRGLPITAGVVLADAVATVKIAPQVAAFSAQVPEESVVDDEADLPAENEMLPPEYDADDSFDAGQGDSVSGRAEILDSSEEPEPETDISVPVSESSSQGEADSDEKPVSHPNQEPVDPLATLAEDDSRVIQPTMAPANEEPEDPAVASVKNPYDSLWAPTIGVDVEAAAIREEAEEELVQEQVGPPADVDFDDQLDGETIADPEALDVPISGSLDGDQVRVLARFCQNDHPNPPQRSVCFLCNAPVSGEASTAVRPQLGWMKIEGGETIAINGTIVAGRNPKTTALKSAGPPRLVALPYPHVSSNHFALVLEGWTLLVQDLNSSNGTFLRRHGKQPVKLPNTPVPLTAGDLIDLGKGIFVSLEGIP